MADGCAGAGGGGLERADAGLHGKLDAAPALVAGLAVQQLEEQRGHAIDAGIAGGDQGDAAPFCRERERGACALLLRADGVGVARAARRGRPQQVEIAAVADEVGSAGDGGVGARRPPRLSAGADSHQRDPPAAAPAALGLDDPGRPGDGTGAPFAPCLGHGERALSACAGERGGLRHAVAADRAEHDLRRRREPRGLPFQGRGIEEAERHAQPRRDGAHRRLVSLQVERSDAGHCLRRKPACHKYALRQEDELIRRAAPLAAEAEGQDGGMQRDIGHIVARHHAPVCDAEGEAAPVPERRAACRQPVGRGGLGHEAHRLAREQRGGDFLHQGTLAEAPAGGRRV